METISKKKEKNELLTPIPADLTNAINNLAKVLESKNAVERDELICKGNEEAADEREEQLRDKFLMLELSKSQKELFRKIFEFRKERDEKYSEKIEGIFFYMFKKVFYEANFWDTVPEDFKKEFKEAFAEYFEK